MNSPIGHTRTTCQNNQDVVQVVMHYMYGDNCIGRKSGVLSPLGEGELTNMINCSVGKQFTVIFPLK